jgi:hypothetical protein
MLIAASRGGGMEKTLPLTTTLPSSRCFSKKGESAASGAMVVWGENVGWWRGSMVLYCS